LRTAGQWIAPCLEDLVLAASQLETELNSTTDNPLIDAEGGHVHHGGNFQAASVTMATEKVRLSLQMFGKLMFAQSSEVLNTMLNGDLPPNLCFDDPSLSFAMKGIDINMAAYMSELAFLANPVSSHVQNAEMGNQAINSLALISARYTMDAVEMVSLMCANHLFALCQALDLQAMYLEYTAEISRAVLAELNNMSPGETPIEPLVVNAICHTIEVALRSSKSLDLGDRAKAASEAVIAPLWRSGLTHCLDTVPGKVAEIVVASISGARKHFATSNELPTVQFLSRGSLMLYRYVRCELRIPFHKGLVEHATYEGPSPEGIRVPPEQRELIGAQIAKIYQAIRSGHLNAVLVASLTCDSLAAAHDRTDREVLSDNMVHGCNHSTIPATL
jgi:phenylalanine ammonia-lyase